MMNAFSCCVAGHAQMETQGWQVGSYSCTVFFQGGHISIDMLGGGSCMSWVAWLVACFFVVLPRLCHA